MSFFTQMADVAGTIGKVVAGLVTLNAAGSFKKYTSANVTTSTDMANTTSSTLTGSNFGDSILEHIIGSGIDFGYNTLAADLSNKTAQENARYWANYNSPVNQMQRLKEAGLNPALAYGNGNATNTYDGNADAPQIHGVNSRMMYSAEMANLRADLSNKKATNENIAAQTEHAKAQAEAARKEAQLKDIEIREREARNPEKYGKSLLDLTNAQLEQSLERTKAISTERQIRDCELVAKRIVAEFHEENPKFLRDATAVEYEDRLTQHIMLNTEAAFQQAEKENGIKLQKWQIKKLTADVGYIAVQAAYMKELQKKVEAETNTERKRALEVEYSAAEKKFRALENYFRTVLRANGVNPDSELGNIAGLIQTLETSVGLRPYFPGVDDTFTKAGKALLDE